MKVSPELFRPTAKRLLHENAAVTRVAAAYSGAPRDHEAMRRAVYEMGLAFASAGWKPRIRVKARSKKF